MPTSWNGDDSEPLAERGKLAVQRRRPVVEQLFDDADVKFPPAELLLRAFKAEKELEVWASSARGGEMTRVATYGICRISGELGPKRREGDLQVPEGFYRIDYFWPDPSFWLSAKVSYPNPLDKQLGGGAPGGDIMIHGDCASIGCISLSDERMEELWVMGTSPHGPGGRGERAHLPDPRARDADRDRQPAPRVLAGPTPRVRRLRTRPPVAQRGRRLQGPLRAPRLKPS
jgi:hypothetical protein